MAASSADKHPGKTKGGEASPLATASSPSAAGSFATPLNGGAPRNAPTTRLDEICTKIVDCPHSTPVWTESGKIVLRSQNIRHGQLDFSSKSFTDEAHFASRNRRAKPQANDLVITREAPMGEVCIIPKGLECCLGQRMVLLRPDSNKVDSTYLLFALQSAPVQHQIMWSEGTGSTVSNLRIPHLEALKIPTPPLPIQKAIAHILGTLDDRIELCRRMNQTLEAMARALFKDWFIDFGPVRAKMEGREPPGLSPEIAALFPSKLVDSELGEIPEGWRCSTLSEIANNLTRSIRPECMNSETAYIGLEHMPRKDIALSDWGTADGLESNKLEFNAGEILFGKLRPYFHKVGIAPINGVCSTDIIVVGPKKPYWFGFALEVVSSDEFVEHTNAGSTGTKMPRTSWAEMSRFKLVLPADALAQSFDQSVAPMVNTILSNIHRCRSLSTLRDTLLPKLLSGELSIPEAMLQVEAH